MRGSCHYDFLPVKDVYSSINQKINLMGIVMEFAFPKTTQGTDHCCVLRIIDESHHETSMAVNVFSDVTENLPRVLAAGDVIQLCRVKVKEHSGEVNVVFYKSFSSFALYKGKVGDDFIPYQVSSKFVPLDGDKIYVERLRKWLVNLPLNEDRNGYPLFREFKEGQHVNLACKILHCGETAKEQWFIFVWDGTDTPPKTMHLKPESELSCPLPLQLEPLPLPRDLLCTFPTVGTILRITFDKTILKGYLNLLNSFKWVKLVNVRLEVHAGLWYAVFTTYSKIRYTPAEDSLISERHRLFVERMSLKSGSIPSGSMPSGSFPAPSCVTFLPDKYDRVPFVTLMDVLTHSEVTAKFKCVVRVVAALPCQGEKLRAPSGIYRMRLTLEDPTARIHALVVAEDGETLFDGNPSAESLTRKLNILLGVTESDDGLGPKDIVRNPAWVGVCLKSYYVNEEDKWGTRHFRIFDTKIVEA